MFRLLTTICLLTSALSASDRIYIDEKEIDNSIDCFHIHVGGNIWLVSDTIHRDNTGLCTLESSLIRRPSSAEYEKKWKCPYCNVYWPVGKPCQNADCPSRYK
jgi:hypothetical protein